MAFKPPKSAKAKEEWRDAPGFEGIAEVSSLGRVKTLNRTLTRSNGVTYSVKGRNKALVPDGRGYQYVNLPDGSGKKRFVQVHRLVALAFLGGDGSLQVNHRDCDPSHNRVANLEWVTPRENAQHAHFMGQTRRPDGSLKTAKLRTAQVNKIRARRSKGEALSSIAADYGVSFQLISKICLGHTWKGVPNAV